MKSVIMNIKVVRFISKFCFRRKYMNPNLKRYGTSVLCLVLLLSLFTLSGCVKESELIRTGKSGDFTYGVYSDHSEIIVPQYNDLNRYLILLNRGKLHHGHLE